MTAQKYIMTLANEYKRYINIRDFKRARKILKLIKALSYTTFDESSDE